MACVECSEKVGSEYIIIPHPGRDLACAYACTKCGRVHWKDGESVEDELYLKEEKIVDNKGNDVYTLKDKVNKIYG